MDKVQKPSNSEPNTSLYPEPDESSWHPISLTHGLTHCPRFNKCKLLYGVNLYVQELHNIRVYLSTFWILSSFEKYLKINFLPQRKLTASFLQRSAGLCSLDIVTIYGSWVTYKMGFGLDDRIYWHLIHSTRDYRQYSVIADLQTSHFIVANALEFSFFTSRILATGL
jgi:hypothetical protein